MKKLLAIVTVLAALTGPLAPTAAAATDWCKLAEKLGVVWVRECES